MCYLQITIQARDAGGESETAAELAWCRWRDDILECIFDTSAWAVLSNKEPFECSDILVVEDTVAKRLQAVAASPSASPSTTTSAAGTSYTVSKSPLISAVPATPNISSTIAASASPASATNGTNVTVSTTKSAGVAAAAPVTAVTQSISRRNETVVIVVVCCVVIVGFAATVATVQWMQRRHANASLSDSKAKGHVSIDTGVDTAVYDVDKERGLQAEDTKDDTYGSQAQAPLTSNVSNQSVLDGSSSTVDSTLLSVMRDMWHQDTGRWTTMDSDSVGYQAYHHSRPTTALIADQRVASKLRDAGGDDDASTIFGEHNVMLSPSAMGVINQPRKRRHKHQRGPQSTAYGAPARSPGGSHLQLPQRERQAVIRDNSTEAGDIEIELRQFPAATAVCPPQTMASTSVHGRRPLPRVAPQPTLALNIVQYSCAKLRPRRTGKAPLKSAMKREPEVASRRSSQNLDGFSDMIESGDERDEDERSDDDSKSDDSASSYSDTTGTETGTATGSYTSNVTSLTTTSSSSDSDNVHVTEVRFESCQCWGIKLQLCVLCLVCSHLRRR